jgi:hypothetical protein
MIETIKWAIWKNDESEFIFGPLNFSKNLQIIEEFDSFEDAREAWKFYNLFLINK